MKLTIENSEQKRILDTDRTIETVRYDASEDNATQDFEADDVSRVFELLQVELVPSPEDTNSLDTASENIIAKDVGRDSRPKSRTHMDEQQDLTARGTPRIRRKYRTREEIGGDPKDEKNVPNVRLSGRIPRELRDEFLKIVKAKGEIQSAVLASLIRNYLQENDM